MSVTAEDLKDKARERTGLDDFGDPYFEPVLHAYVEDLNAEPLTPTGVHVLTSLMVTDLCRRLSVIDAFKTLEGLDDVSLPPILYISGHERSGTTLIHNLLTRVPGNRALLRWELMNPLPPPDAATYESDPRIASTQASIDKLRGSALEELHWVDADEPDECAWAMIDGSSILAGAAAMVMPRWRAITTGMDRKKSFAEYRKIVQLLLLRNPVPDGGFLVLKSPQFSNRLDAIRQAFPEVSLVLTHRDPFRVCTSVATLTGHINSPFVSDLDFKSPGGPLSQVCIDHTESRLAAMVAFDKADRAAPGPSAINVNYADLVSDPVGSVEKVYQALGRPLPDGTASLLEDYLAAQRAGKRKTPLKTMDGIGLSHHDFLERPIVKAYCEHFDLNPEVKRQTGT